MIGGPERVGPSVPVVAGPRIDPRVLVLLPSPWKGQHRLALAAEQVRRTLVRLPPKPAHRIRDRRGKAGQIVLGPAGGADCPAERARETCRLGPGRGTSPRRQ